MTLLSCACGCGGAHHGSAAAVTSPSVVRPLTTPAPVEPVSLAEAKLHLRVEADQTLEDDLITTYLTSARQRVEVDTEQTWALQTLEARYAVTAPTALLALPNGPVQSVTSVEQLDADGTLTALSGWTTSAAAPAYLSPPSAGWPLPPSAVVVTYEAGPLAVNAVPSPIRFAILLLTGQAYDHRAPIHVGSSAVTLPFGVDWLLAPYRLSTGVITTGAPAYGASASTGVVAVAGPAGPPGPAGPAGPPGASSSVFSFQYSTATTAPPTGSEVRVDAADPTAVTRIWVRRMTVDNVDVHTALILADTGDRVYIQDQDDATKWAKFVLSGAAIDHSTYVEWPVTADSHGVALTDQRVQLVLRA